MTDTNDIEFAQEFDKALRGDRDDAENIWEDIARGNWNIENKYWCEKIAIRLLNIMTDDKIKPKQKAAAIQKAVGLNGKKDPNIEVARYCRAYDFDRYDAEDNIIPEKSKDKVQEIANSLINDDIVSEDRDVEKLVRSLINKNK
jgi:hypothetical protein